MADQQMMMFLLVLSVFHYCSCIENYSRFRRLSSTSSRFAQQVITIKGISLLECAVCGKNKDGMAFNYRAESRSCELIEKAGSCVEYQAGDIVGWQAYRSCDAATEGMIWLLETKIQFVHSEWSYLI